MIRLLRDACLGGFLYGSLTYGTVLSAVHVLHNRLGSTRDALLTYALFSLLYGLWAAAFFGAGALAARVSSRGADPDPDARLRRAVWFGMLAFDLLFWEVFFLYGLTYDQAPFHPGGAGGMVAVLAGLAVLIALVTGGLTWSLFRLLWGIRSRGRLALAVGLCGLLGFLAHAAAPVWSGSAPPPAKQPVPKIAVEDTGLKVLLVGLDGADWRVLRPMLAKGELRAFAALMRDGASGDLATLPDSNSAVIWASIYTGLTPERHGALDFYRIQVPGMESRGLFPVHRTYFKELANVVAPLGLARQLPVDRFSLESPPIWEVADRAGLSTGVVDGYFYSFPALASARPESWFFSYGLDALAARGSSHPELFLQPKQLFRDVRPLLSGGDFHWQSKTLLKLLGEREQPRFVNFYTHEPDSAQHFFWKWYQPWYYLGIGDQEEAGKADRIPAMQRDFDRFLAALLARVGPETVVLVASDHGHSPTLIHSLYTQHRHGPPGILLMRGGPVKPGLELSGSHVYDLYPTMLYLLGLPVPEDAAGRVLLDALDPEFVRRHPVRTIPSYGPLGLAPGLPGASRDGGMNALEIEKLKALGYIF